MLSSLPTTEQEDRLLLERERALPPGERDWRRELLLRFRVERKRALGGGRRRRWRRPGNCEGILLAMHHVSSSPPSSSGIAQSVPGALLPPSQKLLNRAPLRATGSLNCPVCCCSCCMNAALGGGSSGGSLSKASADSSPM